jgi:hypothetical protein
MSVRFALRAPRSIGGAVGTGHCLASRDKRVRLPPPPLPCRANGSSPEKRETGTAKAAPMTCYLAYEGVGCDEGCGCTVAWPRGCAWEARFPIRRFAWIDAGSNPVRAMPSSLNGRAPLRYGGDAGSIPADGSQSVPVLKWTSCEATNLASEVRILPGTPSRSRGETEIIRASEARVASSILAESTALRAQGADEPHKLGLEGSFPSAATTPGSVSGETHCPTHRCSRVRFPGSALIAVVAKWQTRQVEGLVGSLPCEFESRRPHYCSSGVTVDARGSDPRGRISP